MSSQKTFEVYAWYRQFYLLDADAPGDTGSSEFWTEEAFESRLAVQPGVVGIATDTDGEVPVTVEVLESEPTASLDAWDHVAEASLHLSAGRLTIAGCPDGDVPVVSIPFAPGRIRARVYFAGLRDKPGGVEYNGDRYLIQLWPSEVQDRVVLKRFAGRNAGT